MLNTFHDLFHKDTNKTEFMEMISFRINKTKNVKGG